MKKYLYYGLIPVVIFLTALYLLSSYTHTGRVWGLYTFAAFKAPIGEKIECIKETNQKVHDKFLKPLDFSAEAKNALREYWHFSYYRACLFEAGYDFYGQAIEPASLTKTEYGLQYKNPFAQISVTVPENTELINDNLNNPDLDDFRIASLLKIGEADIQIIMDRSYKLVDQSAVANEFAGFDSMPDFPSDNLATTESKTKDALAFYDEPYYGYVVLIPEHHVVTIFSNIENQSMIDEIITSLKILD